VYDSGRLSNTNVLRWFTNDLTLGIIEQLQSGRPYPFSTGTAGFTNGRFFGAGNETQQRPNVLPDGTLSVAGIASAFGSNTLFSGSPASLTACGTAGFTPSQCASMVNTFLAPGSASGKGSIDSFSGEVVDFQFVNGSLERDAGRGSPFARLDMSLKKSFRIARAERVKLELQADALNILNHSNWQGFNTNDVTSALSLGLPNCTNCMRSNGTFVGNSGQVLHVSDITKGKVSSNLLIPAFVGIGAPLAGIGAPASVDGARLFHHLFHVRF